MAETTTVAVRRDVHERLEELKPYESTSFSDVIAGLVEAHTDDRGGGESDNVECPNQDHRNA
jgi:predicted CopG family antitoxin